MKTPLLLLVLILTMQFIDSGWACATFVLKNGDRQVFGRNYDWNLDDALIVANKRGCRKRSIIRPDETGEKAAWTANYGSITFNQYGREMPMGGMNEAGLVVEAMAFPRPVILNPMTGPMWAQRRSGGKVQAIVDPNEF